jgi:hypothetical protein
LQNLVRRSFGLGVSVVGVRSPRKRTPGLWASRIGLGLGLSVGLDFGAASASAPASH